MAKEVFKISNRVYDIGKWAVQVGFPAVIALYATMSSLWGWSMTEQIVGTAAAVATFVGVVLGVSSIKYVNEHAPYLKEEKLSEPYGVDSDFD